jgi:hypothetical protein
MAPADPVEFSHFAQERIDLLTAHAATLIYWLWRADLTPVGSHLPR